MEMKFFEAVKNRRSIYVINDEATISDDKITEILENAVLHCPTPFNSQSSRVILLLQKQHQKFWQMLKDEFKEKLSKERYPATEEKINTSFASGYGTVLFFEDINVVKKLQEQFPSYADNFPHWSQQASGMLQYVVWSGLEMYGMGCSLQHYSPLIDDKIKDTWQVPASWQLIAQMPFGKKIGEPGEKEFAPLSERFKTYR